jgi:DNA-binding NarL/FixJ family response regulator
MTPRAIRVVVADDDPFTVSLVAGGLRSQGFAVSSATSTEEAWRLILAEEPHALVCDLDFGPGESGVALLARTQRHSPWVGLVVLTAHRSPELAVDSPDDIPAGAVYLVKSSLRSVDELGVAVRRAIAGECPEPGSADPSTAVVLTPAQAEVLRLLASGASTRALAEYRGTTVRAAETMLTRLYTALGVEQSERSNPRVEAVRMWQQGRVAVR